jgi:hypothetical protein
VFKHFRNANTGRRFEEHRTNDDTLPRRLPSEQNQLEIATCFDVHPWRLARSADRRIIAASESVTAIAASLNGSFACRSNRSPCRGANKRTRFDQLATSRAINRVDHCRAVKETFDNFERDHCIASNIGRNECNCSTVIAGVDFFLNGWKSSILAALVFDPRLTLKSSVNTDAV